MDIPNCYSFIKLRPIVSALIRDVWGGGRVLRLRGGCKLDSGTLGAHWVKFLISNHTLEPPLPAQMLSVLRDDVIHETRPRTIEQQKITTNKKSPLRHRRGMGDIILDYMGRFSIFSLFASFKPARTQIHQCPGRPERDRKIKLTVFMMWLCSIRGHLFKRSRFGATAKRKKKTFPSSSFPPSPSSHRWIERPFEDYLIDFSPPFCAHNSGVIYINQ